jgi:DNA-binding MarR family transcriptional regulator
MNYSSDVFPLGKLFGNLTKQYIGILSNHLQAVPIERYYYPFLTIAKNSGEFTQQQLADKLSIDKVLMVRIIDYLEKNQFVERIVNESDRRCHLLSVSEKGKLYIAPIEEALKQTDKLFLDQLDGEFSADFMRQLILLNEKMNELPSERIELYYNKITND